MSAPQVSAERGARLTTGRLHAGTLGMSKFIWRDAESFGSGPWGQVVVRDLGVQVMRAVMSLVHSPCIWVLTKYKKRFAGKNKRRWDLLSEAIDGPARCLFIETL